MKVLQINNYHYNFGGASKVYFNTSNLLIKKNHDVIFFSIRDEKNIVSLNEKYFIDKKVKTESSLLCKILNFHNYFYNMQAKKNLNKLLENEKPDIAHIHLFYGGITTSILPVLKKHRVPVVYTAHDYRMICPAYTFLNGNGQVCEDCKGNKFYNSFLKKCSKNNLLNSLVMSLEMYFRKYFIQADKYFDGLIYVSNFAKNKHEEFNPKIKQKANMVLYNSSKFSNIKINYDTKFKNKYFLFYGRFSKEKGIDLLLKAFKSIKKSKLIIAGEGREKHKILKYIKNENISNIDYVGFKFGEDLNNLIKNAFFVIVPSQWYENNPLTIIESYSNGVPIIGSEIGGIPEIINNGKTGFTFKTRDLNDLKQKIIMTESISKNQYKKLSNGAYNFALSNFDVSNYYVRLIEFYNNIIQLNNPKSN